MEHPHPVEERIHTLNWLIKQVETDIAAWRRMNSQSNPSAAAEMREMRMELKALEKVRSELHQMLKDTSSPAALLERFNVAARDIKLKASSDNSDGTRPHTRDSS